MEPGLRGALQYDVLIKYYQTLFGVGHVLVLPYELLAEDEVDFVKKISSFMGWQFPVMYKSGRVNSSSRNRKVIWSSRIMNYPFSLLLEWLVNHGLLPPERSIPCKLEIGFSLFRRRLINPGLEWLFAHNTDLLAFPSTWKKNLLPIFSESNQRLAEMTALDLKRYGYPC
jgi:hypothetical protein